VAEPGAGDEELIAAVVGRDSAALMALYDRYRRVAFALAYRILDDAGAAEEAVQDAFLLVWKRADSFDAGRGSGFRAWLLTIVHHRSIDLRRRRHGRPGTMLDLDAVTSALAVPDIAGDVVGGLERERVRAAVDALPHEQQQTIALAYFEGLTHREIAERTGTPLGTVKGRMRLGLRRLSGILADVGSP